MTWEWLKEQVHIKFHSLDWYLWAIYTWSWHKKKKTQLPVFPIDGWFLGYLIFLFQLMEDSPGCLKTGLCSYGQPTAFSAWGAQQQDWLFKFNALVKPLDMALNLSSVRDTKWLTLEVCRQFQRGNCSRRDDECKFAHPSKSCQVENGRVIACFDSLKVRNIPHVIICDSLMILYWMYENVAHI